MIAEFSQTLSSPPRRRRSWARRKRRGPEPGLRRRSYLTIRNAVAAGRPARPPALGVATSWYLPGLSVLPPRRPVKRKLFAPAWPASVTLPRSVTSRVHLRALRFLLVGLTQARPLPLRPA